jgi:Site-specific recombinase XerD
VIRQYVCGGGHTSASAFFPRPGYEGISTRSFRKWYATEIYKNSGFDIALVRRLLQHSSAAETQRYICIEPQRIEAAIEGHAKLI